MITEKKLFEEPMVEVKVISVVDVITTSTSDGWGAGEF